MLPAAAAPTARPDAADAAARDRLLARRVASGDPVALSALHQRHHARMRRVALSVLRDPHEAEDAAQEAWIRAASHVGACREPGPWLLAVTRNEALRLLRRRGRVAPAAGEMPEPADPHADPAARAEAAESRRLVHEAIAALPGPYREAALRELAGQRPGEVADALGIAAGAARVRMHRARRMIGDRLVAAGAAA